LRLGYGRFSPSMTNQFYFERTPPLSREIGSVMEARRQALRGIRGAGTPETAGKSEEWLQDTVGIKPPKFVD
jgi:hypothetical protein